MGAAVIVNGTVVAWFAELTEEAQNWCTENYFGQWITWRALEPEMVLLTVEEVAQIEAETEDLTKKLRVE